jgi:glucuronate isomerase
MSYTGFIHDNFLLHNKYAEELYHRFAAPQPIIDYHNHLSSQQICRDQVFNTITQAWLAGDHYKWRAMRTMGMNERFITGDATDREKFRAWARTVPHTMRNPLYHWTHLELKRYFDVDELLDYKNADSIYDYVNGNLQLPEKSCRGLLEHMNVEIICTTEDPIDSLKYHGELKNSDFSITVSTAFRPDRAILISKMDYGQYLETLGEVSGIEIRTYRDLRDALENRVSYFDGYGCRLSDHGLNYIPFSYAPNAEVEAIFKKRVKGQGLTRIQEEKFQTALLLFLGEQYHDKGWVQQFHLGALRNTNSRMSHCMGTDTGWDSIGSFRQANTLAKYLDTLDSQDKLAKTIVYNLNPADNEVMASMIGNFNDGRIKGKMQFGSAWWFLDQKDGIQKQLNTLSNLGLISCFIGMLTDSRSFLSFPRHEYFRRVLCNLLGEDMANGELPKELELVGKMVEDISYNNAKEYFDF